MLGGQVAGDGGRPHALLPHEVTVFKESWEGGKVALVLAGKKTKVQIQLV